MALVVTPTGDSSLVIWGLKRIQVQFLNVLVLSWAGIKVLVLLLETKTKSKTNDLMTFVGYVKSKHAYLKVGYACLDLT